MGQTTALQPPCKPGVTPGSTNQCENGLGGGAADSTTSTWRSALPSVSTGQTAPAPPEMLWGDTCHRYRIPASKGIAGPVCVWGWGGEGNAQSGGVVTISESHNTGRG